MSNDFPFEFQATGTVKPCVDCPPATTGQLNQDPRPCENCSKPDCHWCFPPGSPDEADDCPACLQRATLPKGYDRATSNPL